MKYVDILPKKILNFNSKNSKEEAIKFYCKFDFSDVPRVVENTVSRDTYEAIIYYDCLTEIMLEKLNKEYPDIKYEEIYPSYKLTRELLVEKYKYLT